MQPNSHIDIDRVSPATGRGALGWGVVTAAGAVTVAFIGLAACRLGGGINRTLQQRLCCLRLNLRNNLRDSVLREADGNRGDLGWCDLHALFSLVRPASVRIRIVPPSHCLLKKSFNQALFNQIVVNYSLICAPRGLFCWEHKGWPI